MTPLEIDQLQMDHAQLVKENAALRALLVELLRVVKEVEKNLQNVLDKDRD